MKKSFLKTGIIFLFFFFLTKNIYSQTLTLPLTVMPSRQEIEANPGEKKYITITFYNQADEPINGFFKTTDFIVEDANGTPRLIENPDDVSPKFSASSWINLSYDKATLPANDKVNLQAEINIPFSAKPGGRYAAIFFEYNPKNENQKKENYQAGIGASSRIVSLVYIKVNGQINEKAIITRFFAPNFQEYGPIKIETQILNRGDYHISPKGIITLKDFFGNIVDQATLKEKNIFPDMIRNYENILGKKWMIGKYEIFFSGFYGSKGQTIEAKKYVWIFPWRLALVITLTVIIIVLLIYNLYKNTLKKEKDLEEELKKEKEEIEKLKKQLQKKEIV